MEARNLTDTRQMVQGVGCTSRVGIVWVVRIDAAEHIATIE